MDIFIPKAIIKDTNGVIEDALNDPGEWKLYKKMKGASAKQTARKYNNAEGEFNSNDFLWGVDDAGNLYVKAKAGVV